MDRTEYVTATYVPGVADYLLNGDGFRADASRLGQHWTGIFAELAENGYMRRSKTGRYWWR